MSQAPKTRRGSFQFSLGRMLIVVTIVAVASWQAAAVIRQYRIWWWRHMGIIEQLYSVEVAKIPHVANEPIFSPPSEADYARMRAENKLRKRGAELP